MANIPVNEGIKMRTRTCHLLMQVLCVVGILLFSGCLYGYVLSGLRPLAMIVPVGGLSFIAGWCALAIAATRSL